MQNPCAPELTILETSRLLEAFGSRLRIGLTMDVRIRMGDSLLLHRQVEGNARQHKPRLCWDEDGTVYELPQVAAML